MLQLKPSPSPFTIATPAASRPPSEPKLSRNQILLLLALTLFAGIARFLCLDRPAIWMDEAMTYSRVCGSFKELLYALRETGGFAPLHYELYWLIGRFFPLTPTALRIVPAIAGTAMVPAMYYLARQFTSRNTALLAAAFTACSAYMMVYSRDAKMYMHFWLFTALSMACFIAWVRTNFRIHWLLWIMSSIAMVGLHAPGVIIVALQPLMLLAQRPTLRRLALCAAAVALILIGPAIYYLTFNRFSEKIDEKGWRSSNLAWIEQYNEGRTGGDLLLTTGSSFLVSWEWAKRPDYVAAIDPRVFRLFTWGVVGLFALIALGALPWHAGRRQPLGDPDPPLQPWWRSTLWISLWIALPAYGFYCISKKDFIAPWDWALPITRVVGDRWIIVLGLLAIITPLCLVSRRVAHLASYALPGYLLVSLIDVLLRDGLTDPAKSLTDWATMLFNPALPVIALSLVPPAIWYFCASDFRGRMNKTTRFVLITAILFAGCTAIYYGIHFYTHSKIVIDWSEAFHGWHYPSGIHTVDRDYEFHSLWMPRYLGIAWPAFAIAVAALCMRLPGPVVRWAVISLLLSANCANSFARIYLNPEPPLDKVITDVRAAQDRSGPVRTYLQPTPGIIPHPGQQWINSVPSRYYLAIQGGPRMTPGDLSAGHFGIYNVLRPRENISPWMIALDKKIAPQVDHIIVWEHQKDPLPTDNKILAALGSNWSMASEENYHAFSHWMWNSTALIRRREYIKTGNAPTTMPATQSTTRPARRRSR